VTTWETGQSLGKTAVEKFWGVGVGKGQGGSLIPLAVYTW